MPIAAKHRSDRAEKFRNQDARKDEPFLAPGRGFRLVVAARGGAIHRTMRISFALGRAPNGRFLVSWIPNQLVQSLKPASAASFANVLTVSSESSVRS